MKNVIPFKLLAVYAVVLVVYSSTVHADSDPADALVAEQRAFWDRFASLCGQAFSGRLSDVTEYYAEAIGEADFLMHVVDCKPGRVHAVLQVDDNRSRNWIVTVAEGTLRLKHDHRHADGTEEAISQYGGDAPVPGLSHRQIFPADAHTAEILPERADNFWFFDFVGEDRLHYGVHWPLHGHSIRIEFDLSKSVKLP